MPADTLDPDLDPSRIPLSRNGEPIGWTSGFQLSVTTSTLTPAQCDGDTLRPFADELDGIRGEITSGKRFRQIAGVFARHGLSFLLRGKLGTPEVPEGTDPMAELGVRLRLAFQELGPTFIKLGQVLVTRQELLPDAVTRELAKLLDRVPPMPFPYLAAVLAKELPEGLDTFRSIDHAEPLGSASLAQVYRAELPDGRLAAVKVIRPGVRELFRADITVIRTLAKLLHRRLPQRIALSMDLPGLVSDYYSSAMEELDMKSEAAAMLEHAQLGLDRGFDDMLHIPEVFQVSTSVLVMELCEGWSLKDFPLDFFSFEERMERMTALAHYYGRSMLDGNYHADPHASNILVDKHSRKLVVIDWGMVGRMDSVHSEVLFRMLMHIRINQIADAVEAGIEIIQPTKYTNLIRLRDQWRSCFVHYVNSGQSGKYNWGNLLLSFIRIGMQNYCRIPNGLALWAKGFSAAEGAARWLCPEISYHVMAETLSNDIMRTMLARRFNYRANASLLGEAGELVATLPRRLNSILKHLAWNDLQLKHEYTVSADTAAEFRRISSGVTKSVNRLALSIIASPAVYAGVRELIRRRGGRR